MWQALISQHVRFALELTGWCLAFINWVRVRQLKRTQDELLRRLAGRPGAAHHLRAKTLGPLLIGLAVLLLLAERRGYLASAAGYAQYFLAILGWAWALWLWLRARALRRSANGADRRIR